MLAPGTGGSLTGIGARMKEVMPKVKIICADPIGSLLSVPDHLNYPPGAGSYLVEGPGHEEVPFTMQRELADHWIKASDPNAFKYARMMTELEGIMAGGCSGAILYAAVEYAKKFKLGKGNKMVVVLTDCIRHYVEKLYSDNWMVEKGLYPWSHLHESDHLLSKIPIKSLNLLKVPLLTPDSTVGDVMQAVKKGAQILPVLNAEGNIIDGVIMKKLMWFIVTNNLKKSDSVQDVWTRDIAVVPYG